MLMCAGSLNKVDFNIQYLGSTAFCQVGPVLCSKTIDLSE